VEVIVRVSNVHRRVFSTNVDRVGALIDSLSTPNDRLWPHQLWPALKLDRPLRVGATGGHGPIHYRVVDYEPTRRVRFTFTKPTGFHGYHEWQARLAPVGCELRHALVMDTAGLAVVSWPLIWRPMHDALIEDALDNAGAQLTFSPSDNSWSWWVRTLRRAAVLVGLHTARRDPHTVNL
jgi:hypothetical protein